MTLRPAIVALGVVSAGCPSAHIIECGHGGELRDIDGASYCVYSPEDGASGDGSVCPPELPYPVMYGDYLICAAERIDPEDLPPELCPDEGACGPTGIDGGALGADGGNDSGMDAGSVLDSGAPDPGSGFTETTVYLPRLTALAVLVGQIAGSSARDVVTFDDTGNAMTLLGDGRGALGPVVDSSLSPTPTRVAFGDATGDGRADLAIQSSTIRDEINLYVADATGQFVWYDTLIANGSGMGDTADIRGMAIGDVTGDGNPDVIATTMEMWANIWPGDGAGGFGPQAGVMYGTVDMSRLRLADMAGDAALDLVQNHDSTIRVLQSNGSGGFLPQRTWIATGGHIQAFTTADFDGSGRADLLYSTHLGAYIALDDGSGLFGAETLLSSRSLTMIASGDFDGDGNADVVYNASGASYQLGDGTGDFGRTVSLSVYPVGIAVGDLNGDARDDIVIATGGELRLHVSRP